VTDAALFRVRGDRLDRWSPSCRRSGRVEEHVARWCRNAFGRRLTLCQDHRMIGSWYFCAKSKSRSSCYVYHRSGAVFTEHIFATQIGIGWCRD
jgi:hypothetical protein